MVVFFTGSVAASWFFVEVFHVNSRCVLIAPALVSGAAAALTPPGRFARDREGVSPLARLLSYALLVTYVAMTVIGTSPWTMPLLVFASIGMAGASILLLWPTLKRNTTRHIVSVGIAFLQLGVTVLRGGDISRHGVAYLVVGVAALLAGSAVLRGGDTPLTVVAGLLLGVSGLLLGVGVLRDGDAPLTGVAYLLIGVAGLLVGVAFLAGGDFLLRVGVGVALLLVGVAGLLVGVAVLRDGDTPLTGVAYSLVGVAFLLVGVTFLRAEGLPLMVGVAFLLTGIAGLLLGVVVMHERDSPLGGIVILLIGVASLLLGAGFLLHGRAPASFDKRWSQLTHRAVP